MANAPFDIHITAGPEVADLKPARLRRLTTNVFLRQGVAAIAAGTPPELPTAGETATVTIEEDQFKVVKRLLEKKGFTVTYDREPRSPVSVRMTQHLAQNGMGFNPSVKCPHCDTVGTCTTKRTQRKKGVSGGKATAAVFTGGVSMVATGLSRKESVTVIHCRNCNVKWEA